MSRMHRALEKADREGLLTWTRRLPEQQAPTAVEEEPPLRPTAGDHARAFEHTAAQEPAFVPHPSEWDATPPAPSVLNPLLVAATEPTSAAAEQYRVLRTRLESVDEGRRPQLVLVTSPRIGDGKTMTSANLALTMAQEFQQKVVLVEADLRRPSLAAHFGVRPEPGLVDVLVGAATLDDALTLVPDQPLVLLPAGLTPGRATDLLASSMMQRVVAALRARFSRIVVDTPPVGLADTQVLSRMADGVLVVVRAGMTPRPAVERALATVDRQRLIGVVVNDVDGPFEAYEDPALQQRSAGE